MAQPQVEQRATRRFALRLPVTVKHPDKGDLHAVTRDISSRGICFRMDASVPLAMDSDLQFTLILPPEITLTSPIRVRCFAHVVRVNHEGPSTAIAATIHRYEFLTERC